MMSTRQLARTALISLACSVAATTAAWSQSAPPGPGASAPTHMQGPMGHPGGRQGHEGRGGAPHKGMHPGMLGPVAAAHIEQLLDDVNATDGQRAQIRVIGDKARADLRALHKQFDDARQGEREAKEGPPPGPMALLTQAKVDASGAEKQRAQMVAFHDATSKRMLQAVVDIANVLTPEQRVALGEAMKARPPRMGPNMGPRGPQGGERGDRDGRPGEHADAGPAPDEEPAG